MYYRAGWAAARRRRRALMTGLAHNGIPAPKMGRSTPVWSMHRNLDQPTDSPFQPLIRRSAEMMLRRADSEPVPTPREFEWGIVLAVLQLGVWSLGLLGLLFSQPNEWVDAFWAVPAILGMTWLYTGLFITAHDAMHGALSPRYPRVNHIIGTICTTVYAGLSYKTLKEAHHRHHDHVGREGDPDIVTSGETSVFFEFGRFMASYLTLRSMGMMIVVSWVFLFFGISLWNMMLFWVVPSFGSAVQLYVVGTWMPHRPGPDLCETYRARTLDLPPFWSLIACYHFGYHVEHHAHPHVPWWRLPQARKRTKRLQSSKPHSS